MMYFIIIDEISVMSSPASSSASVRPRSGSSVAVGASSQEESEREPAERILITSTGPACEHHGPALGEYQLEESHENATNVEEYTNFSKVITDARYQ